MGKKNSQPQSRGNAKFRSGTGQKRKLRDITDTRRPESAVDQVEGDLQGRYLSAGCNDCLTQTQRA